MALKKTYENPKTTDTILFEITTPNTDGCFTSNPYKIDNVVVYYIERDFLGKNWGQYDNVIQSEDLKKQLVAANKKYCEDPNTLNLREVEKIQGELESSSQKTSWFFRDRTPIKVFGNSEFPAWLSTDLDNAMLKNIPLDEAGNVLYGHYTLEWNPQGSAREGQYFLCWTWTPSPSGEKLSAHIPFFILGDPRAVITIPTHICPDDKYHTLLERYLPEMYKSTLSDSDLTPNITNNLNLAVADGFTFLENLANQIIDLFDANALHESLLVYLSNLFNLRLKSPDPTLWRRQIKEAIPLFKQKGTMGALKGAFKQAGMTLDKFGQYWQITSKYTYQESFRVKDGLTFELTKNNIITPINEDNFGLWIRRAGQDEYISLSKDHVTFDVNDNYILTMTWAGEDFSVNPVYLNEGDILRVLYQHTEIPNSNEQQLENYFQTLHLMDQRDEHDQVYPPKNWNVRLIEEDDALFDVLVPVRHPFHDDIIFGHIRTEFAYSENIYNMEEYNGSTRPSYDPCNIGKEFIDPCGSCISSNYSVDINIEDLSNDRIVEAQSILKEYMPFHAVLHSINFTGEFNDFVMSPTERIEMLVTFNKSETVLSGEANPFFHRIMEGGLSNWIINRESLADKLTVLSGKIGTVSNDHVAIVAIDINFEDLGVIQGSHILEILSPSSNAGTYTIDDLDRNVAKVTSPVVEPLDQSTFSFNLSNVTYGNSVTSIVQDDLFKLSDLTLSFAELGVKTLWDVDHTPDYNGTSWKISIPAYSATSYEIKDVISGILILKNNGSLPISNASGLSYIIYDDNNVEIATSTSGNLNVERQGLVDINDIGLTDIENFIKVGDFVHYDGQEYQILAFNGRKFWIKDYTDGDVGGASINIRRRLVRDKIGVFGYRGLKLTTFSDHEAEYQVVNGSNPPAVVTDDSKFKENFMFKINNEFFKILSWDKKEVVLAGKDQSWGLSGGVAAYAIVHFPKKEVNVQFLVFDHLDRDGHDVITREIEDQIDQTTAIEALANSNGMEENVSQEEGVSITIERRNGNIEKGDL